MFTYDPRTISKPIYHNLGQLQQQTASIIEQKEQKNQAIELYTYIATWGLLRLKAEESALNQNSKRAVVQCFFNTLGQIAFPNDTNNNPNPLAGRSGLNYLAALDASEYLGLTGLALQVAREFAFWAEALYVDVANPQNPL